MRGGARARCYGSAAGLAGKAQRGASKQASWGEFKCCCVPACHLPSLAHAPESEVRARSGDSHSSRREERYRKLRSAG